MWLKNIELFTRFTKKNKLWKWQEEQKTLFKDRFKINILSDQD